MLSLKFDSSGQRLCEVILSHHAIPLAFENEAICISIVQCIIYILPL